MSVFLITSSPATSALIPAREFCGKTPVAAIAGCENGLEKAGEANGRALAYIAHKYLGDGFGTVYDVSTILILWFAGASAMAALLNLVPRYLPRYGMAPRWAAAARPLVIVFSLIAFWVTVLFKADVDAQGGAYATGVLVRKAAGRNTRSRKTASAWTRTSRPRCPSCFWRSTSATPATSRASDFSGTLSVHGAQVDDYRILRAASPSVPNAIAALLLHLRDKTGKRPHAYFAWSEGNPLAFMLRYLAFGQGDTAPVAREVLRQAEPDPGRRPKIHVDG